METKEVVPIQLVDQKPIATAASKPKIAARVKLGEAEVNIYNGSDKYILATILKELSIHASRLHSRT
ncbi:hypothetical protein [Enterococcus sp. DIV0187]|uniref:hypothetical protein n=1 Tax=Enterococcus sp. DIV0187 TaxID=2774644 RepID=UPI003F1F869B